MSGRSIRVVVVDDGPSFRKAATAFLATQPHVDVVGAFESGLEAIEAAALLSPDLILMDLHMPGMTGLNATRAIKRFNATVKVVAVTLYDRDWHRSAALDAGADGFISKASFTEACPPILAALAAEIAPSR